ncbi:hypothetical protein DRE_04495 [Drechslerella stenobrocha 248]|uniref:cellulase n=1 Tax=Drechslerella stenobrocha 248 TaxID=1043628 RepID=W7HST0_9PEZI|nr:hypothetical protein DRE_04495 [Drechslerella stenobrocha 248]
MAIFTAALILAIVPSFVAADKISGVGSTGLYWDCCKPSCSWIEKGPWLTHPVNSCRKDDSPLSDFRAGSGCGQGGTAYVCNNQQPWAVNDTFSYGFISAFIVGATERDWCGSCYELEFINSSLEGKRMVVQAVNTGYDDPTRDIFGIGAPGEYDYANGCLTRYDGNNSKFLGRQGATLTTRDECGELPEPLQPGCYWRFDWWQNVAKPNMTFQRIKCPDILTNITGSIRDDEQTFKSSAGRQPPLTDFGPFSLLTICLTIAFWALVSGI